MSFIELFTQNKNISYLMDQLDAPLIYVSAKGVVKDANKIGIKILHLSPQNYIGTLLYDHCKKNNFSLMEFFNENMSYDNPTFTEAYFINKNLCKILWKKITTPSLKDEMDFLLIGSLQAKEISSTEDMENTVYFYDNILSKLPANVYWKDRNSVYMGCNDRLANIMGLPSRQSIIGMTDYDFDWDKNAAQSFIEFDKKVMNTGVSLNTEDVFKAASGNVVTVLTNKTPLKNRNGETTGVLAISVDITERKKMEAVLQESRIAAEAASQAKTEFLENMRHDIRTPLSGIMAFSEVLKSESHEPHIKDYADNLIASSRALNSLMNEVLEAVRVSSGEIPMLKRKFNITDTFEHIAALYSAKAHVKQLKLSLTIDNTLPRFVIGDKIRLHRIALELVGNAMNFTDQGHVTIDVALAKKEDRNLVIKMMVTDSGMGIPKDKQQEIYLQFKRLTPSYQGIYKGAGLGLFVVKQFIDDLQGEIYVESETQKGTCFTCLIPLQESLLDDASGIDPTEDLKTEKSYLAPLMHQLTSTHAVADENSASHVLVVEDSAVPRMAANAILSSMSCKVDLAESGSDAITLCEKNHYNLILMDIGLGDDMDGYEVTHRIRTGHVNKLTPIIALTAHAGDDNKQRCIEAGMNAVLIKPLTQAQATDILKAFIPARQAATAVRRDLPDSDEEMFQLEQFALLDIEQALQNCQDEAMLAELLGMMIRETSVELEQMKKAFEAQDYPTVEKIAHKIKGGAVYIGTTRMRYACQYVERYWKTGNRELVDKLYFQAVKAIQDTLAYIDSSYVPRQDKQFLSLLCSIDGLSNRLARVSFVEIPYI